MRNSTFCKIFLHLCYSDIPNCMADTMTGIQQTLQSTVVTPFIFSQSSKLNFDKCWWFDMFYYHTFLINQTLEKWMEGNKHFFYISQLNETYIYMSKYRVKTCPQVNCDWVFLRKDGHILSYHVFKIPKVLQKIYFRFVKK